MYTIDVRSNSKRCQLEALTKICSSISFGSTLSFDVFFVVFMTDSDPRGGGGGVALPYLGVLDKCRWTESFFELPTLGNRLACTLLICQAIISRIPSHFSAQ